MHTVLARYTTFPISPCHHSWFPPRFSRPRSPPRYPRPFYGQFFFPPLLRQCGSIVLPQPLFSTPTTPERSTLIQINQYRDALDVYSRAVHINPYIPKVWFNLGSSYESCNNQIGDAIDAYVRAAELDPGNDAITQQLHLLKHSQATGAQLPAAPAPQDVHPTAYAGVASTPGGQASLGASVDFRFYTSTTAGILSIAPIPVNQERRSPITLISVLQKHRLHRSEEAPPVVTTLLLSSSANPTEESTHLRLLSKSYPPASTFSASINDTAASYIHPASFRSQVRSSTAGD